MKSTPKLIALITSFALILTAPGLDCYRVAAQTGETRNPAIEPVPAISSIGIDLQESAQRLGSGFSQNSAISLFNTPVSVDSPKADLQLPIRFRTIDASTLFSFRTDAQAASAPSAAWKRRLAALRQRVSQFSSLRNIGDQIAGWRMTFDQQKISDENTSADPMYPAIDTRANLLTRQAVLPAPSPGIKSSLFTSAPTVSRPRQKTQKGFFLTATAATALIAAAILLSHAAPQALFGAAMPPIMSALIIDGFTRDFFGGLGICMASFGVIWMFFGSPHDNGFAKVSEHIASTAPKNQQNAAAKRDNLTDEDTEDIKNPFRHEWVDLMVLPEYGKYLAKSASRKFKQFRDKNKPKRDSSQRGMAFFGSAIFAAALFSLIPSISRAVIPTWLSAIIYIPSALSMAYITGYIALISTMESSKTSRKELPHLSKILASSIFLGAVLAGIAFGMKIFAFNSSGIAEALVLGAVAVVAVYRGLLRWKNSTNSTQASDNSSPYKWKFFLGLLGTAIAMALATGHILLSAVVSIASLNAFIISYFLLTWTKSKDPSSGGYFVFGDVNRYPSERGGRHHR